ncbi:MFS transporter [Streptomyces sp. NBRC 110028]|uniref:MFS transporter n=1 Tax=Streptomyces sp. NBRC 110028 TaxID=1621260 RepID=UPI0006E3C23A|nr:MFS transporter [Streptomyces sp. NBRC 110028]
MGSERAVRTSVLLVVVLTAGAYPPGPLYPGCQRLFGYDDLVMTLLFATFAWASGPALLLCGPVADLSRNGPVLRLSVLLAAAGSGCFLLADSPAWLFTGRIGDALALGAATGAAQALIAGHARPTARMAGPLLAGLTFAAGTALGPMVSGVLAEYVPGTLITPSVTHLTLLAWVWQRLRRTVPAPMADRAAGMRWHPTHPHIPRDLRTLFLVAGLGGFLARAVVGIYLALLPALLEQTPARRPSGPDRGRAGERPGVVPAGPASRRAPLPYAARSYGLVALAGSLLLLASPEPPPCPPCSPPRSSPGSGTGSLYGGAARARPGGHVLVRLPRPEARPPAASGVDHQVLQGR